MTYNIPKMADDVAKLRAAMEEHTEILAELAGKCERFSPQSGKVRLVEDGVIVHGEAIVRLNTMIQSLNLMVKQTDNTLERTIKAVRAFRNEFIDLVDRVDRLDRIQRDSEKRSL